MKNTIVQTAIYQSRRRTQYGKVRKSTAPTSAEMRVSWMNRSDTSPTTIRKVTCHFCRGWRDADQTITEYVGSMTLHFCKTTGGSNCQQLWKERKGDGRQDYRKKRC